MGDQSIDLRLGELPPHHARRFAGKTSHQQAPRLSDHVAASALKVLTGKREELTVVAPKVLADHVSGSFGSTFQKGGMRSHDAVHQLLALQ